MARLQIPFQIIHTGIKQRRETNKLTILPLDDFNVTLFTCLFIGVLNLNGIYHLALLKDVHLSINISAYIINNRPFSYTEKESQSNDTLLHFVEFSNVHNCDRNSNATRSNLVYENIYK